MTTHSPGQIILRCRWHGQVAAKLGREERRSFPPESRLHGTLGEQKGKRQGLHPSPQGPQHLWGPDEEGGAEEEAGQVGTER